MNRALPFIMQALLLIISGYTALAQPTLVKDLNTTPAQMLVSNEYSNDFCNCGQYTFFPASTFKGRELWRTDGTTDGTVLVKDINVGAASGIYLEIHCNGNGTVFFLGDDGIHGLELWASDGTETGTRMVKDLTPGPTLDKRILGALGGYAYYVADSNSDLVNEIWRSDGTEINTTQIALMENNANIYFANQTDTHIFFQTIAFPSFVYEYWSLNTSTGSLTKVLTNKSIVFGTSFGNKLMFAAYDQTNFHYSLWSSDGTLIGTEMIKDFGIWSAQSLFKFKDKLIFTYLTSTWISDGTEVGTTLLTNGSTDAYAVIGDYFYGFGFDFNMNYIPRLFKTDGVTVDVTNLNGDLTKLAMYGEIPRIDNRLILQYYEATLGTELGISDEQHQVFSLLKDINPGSSSSAPRAWTTLNNNIIFIADDGVNGFELWLTDGTSSGTKLLKNVASGTANAFPYYQGPSLAANNETLYVLATTAPTHNGLFTSDGSTSGTSFKYDFGDVPRPIFFGKTNTDLIYFTAGKFYKTNDSQNVSLFKDISSDFFGQNIPLQKPYTIENKLLFTLGVNGPGGSTGDELWVTDGTDAGTHILKDINPGPGSGITGQADILNSKLIFTGYTPETGSELWITDAIEAGTVLLKDINLGSEESFPTFITSFNNKIIFSAFDNTHGREPWITDGTSEGTTLLIDLVPGAESSEARNFTRIGNELLFTAFDSEKGWCLWRTNGTAEGTVFIKDIELGNEKGNAPTNLVAVGENVYFIVNDFENGFELWVINIIEPDTFGFVLVNAPLGSKPSLLTPLNGLLYFKFQSSLWLTNGTINGTIKIFEYEPYEILNFDNTLYFTALHPDYGIELFKYEFKKFDQQIVFSEIGIKTVGDADFMIDASATSGLPIIITSEDELSISNGAASIIKAGTVKVTIQQLGDELFNPAPVIDQTFCINPAKPNFTISSNTLGLPLLTSNAIDGNLWFMDDLQIENADQKQFEPAEAGSYKVNVTIDGCTSQLSDAQIVEKINQQIIFNTIDKKVMGDSPFVIEAIASSGLPVIITTEEELTTNDAIATIIKPGAVKITIQQSGNGLFNPAVPVAQEICIYPAKPTILESEDTGSITLTSSSNDGNQWYKDGSIIMETQNIFKPVESGSYSVNVIIEDCASERSNEHVILITAIEGTDSALEIFPNPAQESVYIKHHIGNATVNIMDQQGKRVFNLSLQGAGVTECSISHLSKGLYVIQVIEGDKVTFNKLIKE
jgi:ELWxxDGT repeat protein